MLFFYRLIINIIFFISPIIVLIRIFKKKEHTKRFFEKFCFFLNKRNKGKLIWFHGSSVGEILSIVPLIEKLEKQKDIKQILVTSSTLSSSAVLKKIKLKKTIHQFFPIDTDFLSQKFLDHWKPSLAIFIESEIWPNMILNLKKKSIPLLLLNARITKKSFNRWNSISSLSKTLFGNFDGTFPQNNETKKYLKILGAKRIKMIGNLKFSENEIKKPYTLNKKLNTFFKSKQVWCASSTHKSEEKICAIAHKKLKKKYKNLLTIIIPRHVNRIKDITEEIKDLELNYYIHGSQDKINKNKDKWYGFNTRANNYVNMFDEGVIDPTKVTRLALENSNTEEAKEFYGKKQFFGFKTQKELERCIGEQFCNESASMCKISIGPTRNNKMRRPVFTVSKDGNILAEAKKPEKKIEKKEVKAEKKIEKKEVEVKKK